MKQNDNEEVRERSGEPDSFSTREDEDLDGRGCFSGRGEKERKEVGGRVAGKRKQLSSFSCTK